MLKHLVGGAAAVVTAVVLALGPSAQAGRIPNVGHDETVVLSGQEVTYTETFASGETAAVAVAGDGGTRLAVEVYDEYGHLICSDTGYVCVVKWTPRWTGDFKIKVINLGRSSNAYAMRTN